MAVRTSAEAVEKIIEVDELITDLDPFILSANKLVTKFCASEDYDDEELEMIERWLAAHFYAIRDPRITQEAIGPIRENKQVQLGLHFNVTTYGQHALVLDYHGGLATLQKNITKGTKTPQVGAYWLGGSPSEIEDILRDIEV